MSCMDLQDFLVFDYVSDISQKDFYQDLNKTLLLFLPHQLLAYYVILL
jgi:hypothetical protein